MGNSQSKTEISTTEEMSGNEEINFGKSPTNTERKSAEMTAIELSNFSHDFQTLTFEVTSREDVAATSKSDLVKRYLEILSDYANRIKKLEKSFPVVFKIKVKKQSRSVIKKVKFTSCARKQFKYPSKITSKNTESRLLLLKHKKIISELELEINKKPATKAAWDLGKAICVCEGFGQSSGSRGQEGVSSSSSEGVEEQVGASGSGNEKFGQFTFDGEQEGASGSVSEGDGEFTVDGKQEGSSGSVSEGFGELQRTSGSSDGPSGQSTDDGEPEDRFYCSEIRDRKRNKKKSNGADEMVTARFSSSLTLLPGLISRNVFNLRPLDVEVQRFEVRVAAEEGVCVSVYPARKKVVAGGRVVFTLCLELERGSERSRRFQLVRRSWREARGGLQVVQLTMTNCGTSEAPLSPDIPPLVNLTSKTRTILENISQLKNSLLLLGGCKRDTLEHVLDRADRYYRLGKPQEAWETYLMVHTAQEVFHMESLTTITDMLLPVCQLYVRGELEPWNSFLGICEERMISHTMEIERKVELVKSMGRILMNQKKNKFGVKLFTNLREILETKYGKYDILTLKVFIVELYFRQDNDNETEEEIINLFSHTLSIAEKLPQNEYKSVIKVLDLTAFGMILNVKNAFLCIQNVPDIFEVPESHTLYKHSIFHQALYQTHANKYEEALKILENVQELARKYDTERDGVSLQAMLLTALLQSCLQKFELALETYTKVHIEAVKTRGDSMALQALIGKCETLCEMERLDEAWTLYLSLCGEEGLRRKPRNSQVLLEFVYLLNEDVNPGNVFDDM